MRRSTKVAMTLAAIGVLGSADVVTEAQTRKAVRDIQQLCRNAQIVPGAAGQLEAGPMLHSGDRVIVIRRSKARRRLYVVARNGQGWVPASALCKRRR